MWTRLALALVLGLAPNQAEKLTITNVRATYGELGPLRSNDKLLPNDSYYVAFKINGFKLDQEGKIIYTMGMQLANEKGKVIYSRDPQNLETLNILGGSSLPAYTFITAGLETPPGKYTLKVMVADRASKAETTMSREFDILPKAFGIIRLTTSYDAAGQLPAPPGGVTGQSIWVTYGVTGFECDKTKKQPDVSVELRVLDENGKPVVTKPQGGRVNTGVEQVYEILPFAFRVTLNRPGKFTVELSAADKIANKTEKMSFPLTVTEQKATVEQEQK